MPANDSENLSIAEPEDFFVTRDDEDELQPVTQPVPGVQEQIRVVPLTMGDLNRWGGANGQLNPAEIDAETSAEIINEHWYDVRERDDFEVTAEMIDENMIGYGHEALLTAILRASGYDMQNALNMENLELLQEFDDPGKLKEFAQALGEDGL